MELNRAVVVAQAGAPAAALEIVDRLELGEYRYLESTRRELLRPLGRFDEARWAYERALWLAATEAERRYLTRRLAALCRSSSARPSQSACMKRSVVDEVGRAASGR